MKFEANNNQQKSTCSLAGALLFIWGLEDYCRQVADAGCGSWRSHSGGELGLIWGVEGREEILRAASILAGDKPPCSKDLDGWEGDAIWAASILGGDKPGCAKNLDGWEGEGDGEGT